MGAIYLQSCIAAAIRTLGPRLRRVAVQRARAAGQADACKPRSRKNHKRKDVATRGSLSLAETSLGDVSLAESAAASLAIGPTRKIRCASYRKMATGLSEWASYRKKAPAPLIRWASYRKKAPAADFAAVYKSSLSIVHVRLCVGGCIGGASR
jgi:hypothetical protein